MSGRWLMALGGVIRLIYGLAALFKPRLVAGRLAAAEGASVMNLRGFGGQHVAIGAFTILASRSTDLVRPVLLLNAGIEVCDATAGALEGREKGPRDPLAMGGVVLPALGLMIWLGAWRTIDCYGPQLVRGGQPHFAGALPTRQSASTNTRCQVA